MNDTPMRPDVISTKLVSHVDTSKTQMTFLRARASWEAIRPAALPILGLVLGLLAFDLYIFAGKLIPTQFTKVPISPLYVPVAVVTSVLLLTPPRRWWLYLFATYIFQVALFTGFGYPLGFNLVAEAPTAIEPLIVAYLLYRLISLPPQFASLREVSIYAGCVTTAAMISAFMGAGLQASLSHPYWPAWRSWFLGDDLANLLLAPAIVLWVTSGAQGLWPRSRRRAGEIVLWSVTFLLVGYIAFGMIQDADIIPALIYVPVPLLLWAAVRFDARGLASVLALVTVFAVIGVAHGTGPFAGRSTPANVISLQLFLAVIGVPLFFFAALVQERRQTQVEIERSEKRYRTVVEMQTELVSRSLPDTTLTFVNEAHCRFLGKSKEELLGTKWLETVPESARERVCEAIRSLLEHPGFHTIEHETILPDGSLRWQQWVNRTICDADGRVIELQSVGRDITERKQVEADMERLTMRLLQAQDDARRRIARELHDGTAQSLVAINLNLQHLQQLLSNDSRDEQKTRHVLSDSQALGQQTLREIRTLSYLLHPPRLDETGLVEVLRSYAQGFSERSGIRVDLKAPADLGCLPEDVAIALFRIVQEGLTNVHRHSGSPSARIRLTKRGRTICLQLQDRGGGMAGMAGMADGAGSTGDMPDDTHTLGVGIPGMRQRLRQLGGRLDMQSSPRGTTITAIVPVAQ